MTEPSLLLLLFTFPKCAQIDLACFLHLITNMESDMEFKLSFYTHPLVQCLAVSTQLALIRVPVQKNLTENFGPNKR